MKDHITLHHREGASDKIYEVTLAPEGDGFVVHVAYGRRGSTLNTGSKTPRPVPLDEAKSIFDRLIRSKLGKGYRIAESSCPTSHPAESGQDSGLRPQLLNPILASAVPKFLRDPAWAMQEKHDGLRLLLRRAADGSVQGSNRKGRLIAVPPGIVQCLAALACSLVLDGECVGDTFHAFDLLEVQDTDLRVMPYHARLFHLSLILGQTPDQDHVRQVITATTTAHKTMLFDQIESSGREGVVFKRLDAPYQAGRPASGGDALKWKFYETASFVVRSLNAQRSAGLGLLDGGDLLPAGNVTIPPNHPLPAAGDIVEVRYLYAFPESGAVYQPVYLGRRGDLSASDCRVSQLKFKPTLAA